MLKKQCADVDIIITTALIPNRPAPKMIYKDMIAQMKAGSVTVDLAAETGGNIETTVKDERFVTDNGVICLGYTDLVSRLPTTSSSLYGNNISKFLCSIGPFTTKNKGEFLIDESDEAVRGMVVLNKGEMLWPPPPPVPKPKKEEKKKEVKEVVIDYKAPYVQGSYSTLFQSKFVSWNVSNFFNNSLQERKPWHLLLLLF